MSTPDDGHKAEVNDELAAMRKLVAALQPLDQASRRRVLTWLFDRYQHETATTDDQSGT